MKHPDKQHTTNYFDTFIEIASDCKVLVGQIPTIRNDKKTVAFMQFELLLKRPYQYTSDDIFFQVYANRNDLIESEYENTRQQFFSKGQPCFRASPLTKQFGWCIDSDKNGKIAIYGRETEKYQQLVEDSEIKKVRAMQTSKNKKCYEKTVSNSCTFITV